MIYSFDELSEIIKVSKLNSEKIVMTNGCFDILHAGHITYLEEAKLLGDRLLVAVNDDVSVSRLKGPKRPINSLDDRLKVLNGLVSVDWVISFSEDTPVRLIKDLKPDVLVKGGDYQLSEIIGGQEVLANGGKIKALSYKEGFSTSAIIEKLKI
ncbi:MAG TPA: D-glycero-beta-D-manno-heptose 1-phosphate adenylyltransferase [Woeseiaceae bacterium]|nr:D-glycero-beta-D-manno-heptose 1-phosphate adenylyltransferase [Woeseiaceae bacterium]|tara:strand:- start:13660 stop:14121 length:462 start_codon:yes stop_codon:yes gene_type:complete